MSHVLNNIFTMNEIIKSSKDPKEISRTVKGGLIAVFGAIISIAVALGVDPAAIPSEASVTEIANSVGTIAGAASIIVGGFIHLYGLVAKVVNSFTNIKI